MTRIEITVPGKIMLTGEYAVLKGGGTLAASVDAKMRVTLTSETSRGNADPITVRSNLWGEARTIRLNEPADEPLLQAVSLCGAEDLTSVTVDSELNPSYGIGSSSAMRLGVFMGAAALQSDSLALPDKWDAATRGLELQRRTQKHASGYDFATQLLGGVVHMLPALDGPWPGSVSKFNSLFANLDGFVHPFIGGTGAPTTPVMQDTMAWLDSEQRWDTLLQLSQSLLESLSATLADPNDREQQLSLFTCMHAHREFFRESPHFPTKVIDALKSLPFCDERWSFKTTGAGGEDALLLFGPGAAIEDARQTLADLGWRPLPHSFSSQGVAVVRH